jgi:hypothetical protein
VRSPLKKGFVMERVRFGKVKLSAFGGVWSTAAYLVELLIVVASFHITAR